MSDLRDEIARAIAEADGGWPTRGAGVEEDREFYRASADAVLRVVGERLLSDEAGEVMLTKLCQSDAFEVTATDLRNCLSAAWRVATGSNHE